MKNHRIISFASLATVIGLANAAAMAQTTFGDRQVDQLVDDRPELGPLLADAPEIRSWIAARFNRVASGARLHWDNHPPVSSGSEYIPQRDFRSSPPCVRVTDRPDVAAQDKLLMLVFELENVQNTQKVLAVIRNATRSRMDFEVFFETHARLEFEALQRTAEHVEQWQAAGWIDDGAGGGKRWQTYRQLPETFEEYFVTQNVDGWYRNYYRTMHDSCVQYHEAFYADKEDER